MTEIEFDAQVWRNFDRVTIQVSETERPWKVKVNSVCFPTHSVQVNMPAGGREWIRCEYIVEHMPYAEAATDAETIEQLHNRVMQYEGQIEGLQQVIKEKNEFIQKGSIATLQNMVKMATDGLVQSKRKNELFEQTIARINDIVTFLSPNHGED